MRDNMHKHSSVSIQNVYDHFFEYGRLIWKSVQSFDYLSITMTVSQWTGKTGSPQMSGLLFSFPNIFQFVHCINGEIFIPFHVCKVFQSLNQGTYSFSRLCYTYTHYIFYSQSPLTFSHSFTLRFPSSPLYVFVIFVTPEKDFKHSIEILTSHYQLWNCTPCS